METILKVGKLIVTLKLNNKQIAPRQGIASVVRNYNVYSHRQILSSEYMSSMMNEKT